MKMRKIKAFREVTNYKFNRFRPFGALTQHFGTWIGNNRFFNNTIGAA